MHKMNNLEYAFSVAELRPKVVGRHFNRIRKISESCYRLKIANTEIIIELGVRIHETLIIEPSEQTDKFVEKVGKELDNSRVLSIDQVNRDRIVGFDFDKGRLIFEMFGEGNAILVRDGLTIAAARYESWSDREIKAGSPYSAPKNVPADSIEPSDKFIIVSLMRMPLGKEYAQEALRRAGVDEKTPGRSLDEAKLASIKKEIEAIRSAQKPLVFFDREGKPLGLSLAMLSEHSGSVPKEYPSFGEAADAYYSGLERANPALEKLQKRLEKQVERMQELQDEEKSMRERGDFIYSNYQQVEAVLALAKAGKFEELEKSHSAKADKKEKSVEVDIG